MTWTTWTIKYTNRRGQPCAQSCDSLQSLIGWLEWHCRHQIPATIWKHTEEGSIEVGATIEHDDGRWGYYYE